MASTLALPTTAEAMDLAQEGLFVQDVYDFEPLDYYFEEETLESYSIENYHTGT